MSRKPQTDQAYNESVKTIIGSLAKELSSKTPNRALSVIFGTHNRDSVQEVIDQLQVNGLARKGETGRLVLRDDVVGRVGIAQLYGEW
jgi:proline dehydrogenase